MADLAKSRAAIDFPEAASGTRRGKAGDAKKFPDANSNILEITEQFRMKIEKMKMGGDEENFGILFIVDCFICK